MLILTLSTALCLVGVLIGVTLAQADAGRKPPTRATLKEVRESTTALRERKCLRPVRWQLRPFYVSERDLPRILRRDRHRLLRSMRAGGHRCGPLTTYAFHRIPRPVIDAFICIHRGEGSWTDTGDPYWGGLQMDRSFMDSYGSDAQRKYGGFAHRWPPFVQIIVANRARESGRGFYPWPHTARVCGLI